MMNIFYLYFLLLSYHFCLCNGQDNYPQQDCILSQWSTWSKCSNLCARGQKTRSRNINQKPKGVFAKDCPKERKQNVACGEDKNGCQMLCENDTGNCYCKSGYEIDGTSKKKCYDIDECIHNDGRGACAQKCTNTEGSYECFCSKGFILAPDGHACIHNESIICSKELHVETQSSDSQKKCLCKNELDGMRCDRNLTSCTGKDICLKRELCQTFFHANRKCVPPSYQIPILLKKLTHTEYKIGDKKYQIEDYITDVLEGRDNGKSLDNLPTARNTAQLRRSYYVESLSDIRVKSSFVYVKYGVMDVNDNFRSLKMDTICPRISSSDIQCVTEEDCKILREDALPCPRIITLVSPPSDSRVGSNHKIKSWVYILISGFAIIIVLLIILLFLYLKRGKHSNNASAIYNNNMSQPIIFNTEYATMPQHDTIACWNGMDASNSLYGKDDDELSDGQIPIYESIDNLNSCIEKESASSSTRNNLVNEYNEPRYLVPRRVDATVNIDGNSLSECPKKCIDSWSSNKLTVDLPDVQQPNCSISQSDDKDERSTCSKLVVELTDGEEPSLKNDNEEPRYEEHPRIPPPPRN